MAEDERVVELLADVLASREAGRPLPELLCLRAITHLGMDAVAATLLSTPEHRHVVHASDEDVLAVQDLQLTLGDGPVIDAYRDGRPVLVPDLPHEPVARWPMFGRAAAAAPGYRAVFALPLRVGDAPPLGVLALYRRAPGPLGAAALADALVLAAALALAVVRPPPSTEGLAGLDDLQGWDDLEGFDDPDVLAPPSGGTDQDSRGRWSGTEEAVFQAVGMVVARLGLTPYQALARLRAHAFAYDMTLDEVALAVVERRLRLED